ncbi:MAG: hypothetical protein ACR2J7_00725 [Luteimonas sp.]
MNWHKRGLVWSPDGSLPWARTHAMVPTPIDLPHLGVIRIFFSGCDHAGIARPGFVDVSPTDPTRLVAVHPRPLMDIGLPGTFDENGVLVTSVLRLPDGRLHMYYVGFEIGTRIRYRLLSGLAVSDDDGVTFGRHSPVPILERRPDDLYFRGGPCVLHENGRFRLWYVGGSHWLDIDGKAMPEYRVKYLESADGIDWPGSGRLVLDISDEDEHGFGRPWILPLPGGGYEMYYSVRRKSLRAYRMGYAVSADGLSWLRKDDEMGLDVTPDTFDSDAIMYAAPIRIAEAIYCYYNGNDFGREGFAVAVRHDA